VKIEALHSVISNKYKILLNGREIFKVNNFIHSKLEHEFKHDNHKFEIMSTSFKSEGKGSLILLINNKKFEKIKKEKEQAKHFSRRQSL